MAFDGNKFLSDDIILVNLKNLLEFSNHSLVQFYHRNLAYLIVLYVIFLTIFIYQKKIKNLYRSVQFLIFVLLVQSLLGILTLISDLNIYLASIHQINSVLLILSALNLYYLRAK